MKALADGLTQPDGQRITLEQAYSQLAKKRLLYKFYFGVWGMQTGHPRYSTELTSLMKRTLKNIRLASGEEGEQSKRRRSKDNVENDNHLDENDPSVHNAQPAWDDGDIEMLSILGVM